MSYDQNTFNFYAKNAAEYAAKRTKPSKTLVKFLSLLPEDASILELGSGAGLEALHMRNQGFKVLATEGNPELGKFAIARLGTDAKIMRFDELEEVQTFDAVWANMCLLHTPWEALDDIIGRIHNALKPNGLLMASFKSGTGASRDKLDRYYNLPTEDALMQKFSEAANWSDLHLTAGEGGIGHDGTPYNVLWVSARR